MSSGCLFYRVYAVTVDDDVYEIFRCLRWREEVLIKMTTIQPNRVEHENIVVLHPTVPQERETVKLTRALSPYLQLQHYIHHLLQTERTRRGLSSTTLQLFTALREKPPTLSIVICKQIANAS
ncbi:hypothetical protein RB195_023252 [Necator americanus]|uniref:Phlebovirus glycoprotein G2 fusion domain-containing protein n=1 Tax=Necator americanus TaxID=51031 RepID=A0ABR1EIE9_NECAM